MKTQIDLNEKLSEHFTLREMVQSGTAVRMGIENQPTEADVERMRALCLQVLEPMRRRFGVIRITSGYRCEALNKAVGGVSNSQHLRGEAADVHCSSVKSAKTMACYVKETLTFDQLLIERVLHNGCCWIHVSYVIETKTRKNRKETRVLTKY